MFSVSLLDLKLGIRMLVKYPALSIVGGLGMAVAIATSVGFLAFMQANIYPILPLPEGERVVAMENRDVRVDNEVRQALHDYVVYRDEMRTLTDIGAFRSVGRNISSTDGSPEPVTVAEMTASGFTLARVAPLMGRYLNQADEAPGATPVVVIGHDVWKQRFSSDPNVVGRTLRLGAESPTIVGVMPEGFAFPQNHAYWIPFRANPSAYPRMKGPSIYMFGRLAPGISMAAANAEIRTIGKRLAADHPKTNATIVPMVMPYTHSLTDVQGTTIWNAVQMQLMVSLLLVVVAFNVAVLVYARTATRQGEIAVRSALGASRGRIVRQLFMEGLVLASCATVAGLGIAFFGIRLGHGIMETEGGVAFWTDYTPRPSAILFTLGVTVFAATIIGVLPALQATGKRLQQNLREVSGGTGVRLGKTWTTLIVAQVAIAAAALPSAVSMGWEEMRGFTAKSLFDPTRFLQTSFRAEPSTAALSSSDSVLARAGDAERFGARIRELMTRVAAEPGVEGVTYGAELSGWRGPMEAEGAAMPEKLRGEWAIGAQGVAAEGLSLFGARVLSGRAFTAADMDTTSPSVIVNAAFARQIFGDAPAVGRRIRYSGTPARGEDEAVPAGRWLTIVGITEDLTTNRFAPDQISPRVYYPVPLGVSTGVTLTVRTTAKATEFIPRLRKIAMETDPTMRVGRSFGYDEFERQSQLAMRLVALVVGLVLLSVSLLSAAGVYALTSFTVTRRRREIGIRTALGAAPGQVVRSIFARVAKQIALGLAIGIGGAAIIDASSGGELMGGNAGVLLPIFAVLMVIVAVLAAVGPARRGLRIDPAEALRAD